MTDRTAVRNPKPEKSEKSGEPTDPGTQGSAKSDDTGRRSGPTVPSRSDSVAMRLRRDAEVWLPGPDLFSEPAKDQAPAARRTPTAWSWSRAARRPVSSITCSA
jgi:hypothetical protein